MIARFGRARFRMLFLTISILLSFTTCNVYEYFSSQLRDTSDGTLGDILIQLTLADTAQAFTINQDTVTDGDVELKIGIRIDTDDDAATGDSSGYDLDIALVYYNNSLVSDPSSISLEQLFTEYSGYNFQSIPERYIATLYGSSILFETGGPYMEFYFTDISPTAKSQFYAEYYTPALQADTTEVITGSGSVTDPAGDGYDDFCDIISARIEF